MDTAHNMNVTLHPGLSSAVAANSIVPMRAIVHRQYGAPDVLGFEEVRRPIPGEEDVLVRVYAAGVSIGDHHVVTGKPYVIRLSPHAGMRRPLSQVPGMALAGRVEAVGAKVTTVRPGDEVYGECHVSCLRHRSERTALVGSVLCVSFAPVKAMPPAHLAPVS